MAAYQEKGWLHTTRLETGIMPDAREKGQTEGRDFPIYDRISKGDFPLLILSFL